MGVVSFSYSSNISVADYRVVFTMRIWVEGGGGGWRVVARSFFLIDPIPLPNLKSNGWLGLEDFSWAIFLDTGLCRYVNNT